MKESPVTFSCDRADDLISYLYREASESESQDFEKHVHSCASCGAELLAFGYLRKSIDTWRRESLGLVESTRKAGYMSAPGIASLAETKRTPMAALREFFTLSPVWMRAATAAAIIVICGGAGIGILQLIDGPELVVIESPAAKLNAQEDSDLKGALAARQADEAMLSSLQMKANASRDPAGTVYRQPTVRRISPPRESIARVGGVRSIRPDRSKPRDSMVAEFMPFTHTEEDRSPRLSDLLDYVSN